MSSWEQKKLWTSEGRYFADSNFIVRTSNFAVLRPVGTCINFARKRLIIFLWHSTFFLRHVIFFLSTVVGVNGPSVEDLCCCFCLFVEPLDRLDGWTGSGGSPLADFFISSKAGGFGTSKSVGTALSGLIRFFFKLVNCESSKWIAQSTLLSRRCVADLSAKSSRRQFSTQRLHLRRFKKRHYWSFC